MEKKKQSIIMVLLFLVLLTFSSATVDDSEWIGSGGDLTNGLIAFWNFDTDGTDVHNGLFNVSGDETPTHLDTGCVLGGCYDFNQSNDEELYHSLDAGLKPQSFSISGWFLMQEFNATYVNEWASTSYVNGWSGWRIGIQTSTIFSNFYDGTTQDLLGTGNFKSANWNHYVLTYDNETNTATVYNASEVIQTKVLTGTDHMTYGASDRFTIGGRSDDGSADDTDWGGLLDEIGYWNRTLSLTEVQALYNNGAGLNYTFFNQNITSIVTANGTNHNITNLGNLTTLFVEMNITTLNPIFTNFTVVSPNGSLILSNLNGTREIIGSDLNNWTAQDFLLDYNGTWYWNYTYGNGVVNVKSSTFIINVSDTISPNITIVLPTSPKEGGTPHTVPLSITINDSTQVTCMYDIPAELSPVQNNVSMVITGNSTSLYTATATATISTQGTRNIYFYCNDTGENLASTSMSLTTKEATVVAQPPAGGSGGTTTPSLPRVECEVGEDLYWIAETSGGAGGTSKFIDKIGKTKQELTFQNLGITDAVLSLSCVSENIDGYDPCESVEIENETINLLAGDVKQTEVIFELNGEKEYGDDIFFSINVIDNLGDAGCEGIIVFEHNVDNFWGVWNKLNLTGMGIWAGAIFIISLLFLKVFFPDAKGKMGQTARLFWAWGLGIFFGGMITFGYLWYFI